MKRIALLLTLLVLAAAPASAEERTVMDQLSDLYTSAAEQVAPSVVLIEVEREPGSEKAVEPMSDPFGPIRNTNYFLRPEAGVSGFVIDQEGFILTSNYNVTGGTVTSVTVILPDGSRHKAAVLGRHENWDIALLKIEPVQGLHALEPRKEAPALGSTSLLVGRSSNAGDYNVTAGVVSALSRLNTSALQVSCRMNYGNTGGAVVDLQGRLLGMAVHIRPNNRSGLNTGVGFAAPASKIMEVLPELKEGKVWKRTESGISGGPFLGVGQAQQQPENCPGVQIDRVIPGSSAEDLGLRPGDVILTMSGNKITTWMEVMRAIRKLKVGDELKITWLRGKEEMSGAAILKERPPEY